MKTVNVHEAKSTLSRLLEDVERGETVIIARNGEPVATLSAVKPRTMADAVAVIRAQHPIQIGGLDVKELVNEGRR